MEIVVRIEIPRGSRTSTNWTSGRARGASTACCTSSSDFPTDRGFMPERFAEVRSLSDVEAHGLREMENFVATYKLLEDKRVDLLGWGDAEEAHAVFEAAFIAYTARPHDR